MNFILVLFVIFVVAMFGCFYLYITHKNLKSHMEQSRSINYKLNNKTYKYTPKDENFLTILYRHFHVG
uniref:Uncharacterized protein n=1 Tax=viral metagenome TaxID=1070528 RepID=A0A6C0CTP1_9ZZZZ